MTFEEIENSGSELTPNSDDSGAPSEPAGVADSATKETLEAKANSTNTDPEDKNIPFHKHPRWVERENELKAERESRKALEDRYAQMERQLKDLSTPKPAAKPKSAFVEDLAKINPEYAKWAEEQESAKQELADLKNWRAQWEQAANSEKATNTVRSLHEQNKVPEAHRDWINNALIVAEQRGSIKSLADVPAAYKAAHEAYMKVLDSVKRDDRASHVAAKASSTGAPTSQPKGAPVQAGKAPEWSKNEFERREQLINRVLTQSKASNNL